MADPVTQPRLYAATALGGLTPAVDKVGAWTLSEACDRAIASVTARSGQDAAVAQAMETLAHGPVPIGTLRSGARHQVFSTAQGQWFVVGDHAQDEHLAQSLKSDLGAAASVTEQSDGWAVFHLSGAPLAPVLERLVMADLARLTSGTALRLLMEHMNVFVLCSATDASVEILVARSYARSLHHALLTAMQSAEALLQGARTLA